jgi:hypothetical protein
MTAPTTTRDAAWRATVLTAVREAAEQHGLDPEDLLDSRAFVESLDPLVQLDPDDPALVEGVREAVASATESVEPVTPASDQVPGRVLEARGTDENGGRIFRVRIIDAGDSRNGRRYPHKVLAAAVSKYEGAKAYDHHRTPDELKTSSTLVRARRRRTAASPTRRAPTAAASTATCTCSRRRSTPPRPSTPPSPRSRRASRRSSASPTTSSRTSGRWKAEARA